MLKRTLSLLVILSLAPGLSNCTQGQINGVGNAPSTSGSNQINKTNTKNKVTLNINVETLAPEDIKEIQLDGKKLDNKGYQLSSTKIIFPDLEEGKHVVRFSHNTLGEVDIPVEVKNGAQNNFQFNPQLSDNKIDSWEVGTDSNLDGLIDEDAFFSKDFKSYVVVRDNTGGLNYLPKEDFSSDFRQDIRPPRPEGFQFPELNENEFHRGMPPRPGGPGPSGPPGSTSIKGDQLEYPFPGNIAIPLSDNADKLKGFRAVAITNKDTVFPISTYIIKNDLLVLDIKTFKDQTFLKLYLLDDTGKGILLNIEALKPLITPATPDVPVMPSGLPPGQPPGGISSGPTAGMPPGGPGNMPPGGRPNLPPGGMPPGQPPGIMPINPPNLPPQGENMPPGPSSDGTSSLNLIKSVDLKFTVLENVKLTEEDVKKLNIFEEVFISPTPPQGIAKKILLPVPNSENKAESGYIRITPEGEMVDFISEKDFTSDSDTIILTAKN